jgi:hypothetical protein
MLNTKLAYTQIMLYKISKLYNKLRSLGIILIDFMKRYCHNRRLVHKLKSRKKLLIFHVGQKLLSFVSSEFVSDTLSRFLQ